MLEEILGSRIAAELNKIKEPKYFRGPKELKSVIKKWEKLGSKTVDLGKSSSGTKIQAAVIGEGDYTLVAWGYPHPEEPLGAEALVWLGTQKLKGKLPDLDNWRLVLILCADPDQAANQLWLKSPKDAFAFVKGSWRPTHLGIEADYGFPIDWGPFYQPKNYPGRCHTEQECKKLCGGGGCLYKDYPYRPLPRSIALAEALDKYPADLVASMHHTHTGADYTFLLEREKPAVMEDLLKIPEAVGLGRHLGEPIDRGPRWRRDAPDLIRERGLEYFKRRLERHPEYDPSLVYSGNTSAACYIEAMGRGVQFVCPETALFYHTDFTDNSPLTEKVQARVGVEDRPGGRYKVTRIEINGDWIIASQEKVKPNTPRRSSEKELPYSRAMLGVEALIRRRNTLSEADKLWAEAHELDGLVHHLYMQERAAITVPGAFVHDGAMLIFRSREDYRRVATRAQAVSFRWLWPLHTASLLGNFQNFLAAQDQTRLEIVSLIKRLSKLQEKELSNLPEDLLRGVPIATSMRSQLARVIRLMYAAEK